jgi:hypothetical protein
MVPMTPTRQPGMRPDPRGTRAGRPDLGPEDRSAAVRTWKSTSAVVRWAVLITVVGVGTAAIIAIAVAAVFTLVDSSL